MAPDPHKRKTPLEFIQTLDRRIVYLFFFIFVVIAHFVPLHMKPQPSKATRDLYDVVEAMPLDKALLIDSNWGPTTMAEAKGQMQAVLHHAMRRGLKVVMFAWIQNIQGQKFGYDIMAEVAQEYDYEYGKDWCVLAALTMSAGATLQAFAEDIHGTAKTDTYGTDLGNEEALPMMKSIRDIHDVGLVFRVCYSWEGAWLGFVQGVYGTNIAIGVSAISSSSAYPYLESRQMCGMLAGAPGAAEYEELLKLPDEKRYAKQPLNVLSMAIAYILLMIVLGNVAYFTSMRKTR